MNTNNSQSNEALTEENSPNILPAIYIDCRPDAAIELKNPIKINWDDFGNSETRLQTIQTFCDQMHSKSYVILTLPETMARVFHETHKIQKEFFSTDENEKQKVAIPMSRDIGYKNIPNVKEFFQMRRSNVPNFPWPKNPTTFQTVVSDVWNMQEQMGRQLMEYLAIGLEVAPQKLLNFLDYEQLPDGEFSHSIMSLYHYYYHPSLCETCYIHTDMGLISFIPKSEIDGLQVLDCQVLKWVNVEKMASPNDVVVIGCETLARITGSYYPACDHRVVNSQDRYSIVFKLRARNDAIINCEGLCSPKLRSTLSPFYRSICTVREFIADRLKENLSVNFPGDSFKNYQQCILNPNINNTIN